MILIEKLKKRAVEDQILAPAVEEMETKAGEAAIKRRI